MIKILTGAAWLAGIAYVVTRFALPVIMARLAPAVAAGPTAWAWIGGVTAVGTMIVLWATVVRPAIMGGAE